MGERVGAEGHAPRLETHAEHRTKQAFFFPAVFLVQLVFPKCRDRQEPRCLVPRVALARRFSLSTASRYDKKQTACLGWQVQEGSAVRVFGWTPYLTRRV